MRTSNVCGTAGNLSATKFNFSKRQCWNPKIKFQNPEWKISIQNWKLKIQNVQFKIQNSKYNIFTHAGTHYFWVQIRYQRRLCSFYTESWAHRESVSDAPVSSVLDENFLHAPIFDVLALVGSVQRIGDRCAGHWLKQIEIRCLLHRSQVHEHLSSMPTAVLTNVRRH